MTPCQVEFAIVYAIHNLVSRLPIIHLDARLKQAHFEVAVHFGSTLFNIDVFWLNLILFHRGIEAICIHDCLEHELIQVVQAFDLLL